MRSLVILFLMSQPASAQIEDEPAPVAQPQVPDAVFRALGDRPVLLRMRNGALVGARVLAADAATVTVALTPSQVVTLLPRAEIVEVRLPPPMVPPPMVAPPPPAPERPKRERHFSLNMGIPPAVDLDVDYKLLYAFCNVSLVFPAATAGAWVALSTGVGVNFKVTPESRWKLEVFAAVSPLRFRTSDPWVVGIGVGFGAHYTLPSGFTFGFKIPLFFYDVLTRGSNRSGEGVGLGYMSAATGMPLASLGYRF